MRVARHPALPLAGDGGGAAREAGNGRCSGCTGPAMSICEMPSGGGREDRKHRYQGHLAPAIPLASPRNRTLPPAREDGPFMRRGSRIALAWRCRKVGEPRAIPPGRMHPWVDIVERKAAGSAPSRGKPADCVHLGRKCGYFLTSICPSVQSFPQVGSVYGPEPR